MPRRCEIKRFRTVYSIFELKVLIESEFASFRAGMKTLKPNFSLFVEIFLIGILHGLRPEYPSTDILETLTFAPTSGRVVLFFRRHGTDNRPIRDFHQWGKKSRSHAHPYQYPQFW
jgi:hypothetical protein